MIFVYETSTKTLSVDVKSKLPNKVIYWFPHQIWLICAPQQHEFPHSFVQYKHSPMGVYIHLSGET